MIRVAGLRLPGPVAAAAGVALQCADGLAEFAVESARAGGRTAARAAAAADLAYRDAARRGETAAREGARALTGRANEVAAETRRRADHTAERAAVWFDAQVVRRVARELTPYLIEDLVPRVVVGVMPVIRSEVIPIVIEDLARDEQVGAMVAQQSRGMVTWTVAEARRVTAEADDRVETSVRRILRRRGREPYDDEV